MRRVVVGAAAGLAISMPGALAFSASPSVAALRQPSGLSLRASARKTPLAMASQKEQKATGLNPAAAVANGLLAASLFFTPVLNVVHSDTFSAGGDANAQGFVSSKKTSAAPTTDANKDPESILRLSLPINDKNPIREVQAELELKMDKALREVKTEKWGKIQGFTKRAQDLMAKKEKDILKDVPADSVDDAKELVASIKQGLESLAKTVDSKKTEPIIKSKSAVLSNIGDLESLMVKAFPYEVPKEYANLPQLKGRAEVEFVIKKADPDAQFDIEGTLYDKAVLKVVVDGYTAPVTAGNFVDLVNRGLYKGMNIQRSDGFVVQTGDTDPEGGPKAVHGFKGPDGKERKVPLEVYAIEDTKPTYEITLEDDGRPLSQPKLPFSVYGTVAMARSEDDANDASSQFFFLLFDPELTTAGRNLMDGRFSTFGYVIEGNQLLQNIEVGDVIVDAKVTDGIENLQAPK